MKGDADVAITKMGNARHRKTRRTEYTKGVPAQFVSTDGQVRDGFEEVVKAFKALQATDGKLSQADILGSAVLALAEQEGIV